MQRRRKNLGVLVDRAVLHHRAGVVGELLVEPELVRQKEDLAVERPALHVAVEVLQERVARVRLVEGGQPEPVLQELGERRLACANVAGDGDVLARAVHRQRRHSKRASSSAARQAVPAAQLAQAGEPGPHTPSSG